MWWRGGYSREEGEEMKMWLARDMDRSTWYRVSTNKLKLVGQLWESTRSHGFMPTLWHRAGGLRLKPGEGPVRVDVRVVVKIEKAT